MSEPEKKPRPRVKKKKGHGGHHGGAWKVAYADFVTAMMALFLVLWLLSQADTKLKAALANYFRSPGAFNTMRGGILSGPMKTSKEPSPLTAKDDEQSLYSTAAILQKEFDTRPEFSKYKDQIKIEVTEEGLKIQLLDKAERVSFASGRADLSPEARAILAEIAHAISDLPNPILIGGYTDSHAFASENENYTNWELSTDRANAARRALQENGVKPEQIRRIVGYADTEPLYPEDPYAPGNRRISITVLRLKKDAQQNGAAQSNDAASQKSERSSQDSKPEVKSSPAREESRAKSDAATKAAPDERDAKKERAASGASNETATGDAEKRAARAKLSSEGSVSVGSSDAIPSNVPRTREAARTRASAPPE